METIQIKDYSQDEKSYTMKIRPTGTTALRTIYKVKKYWAYKAQGNQLCIVYEAACLETDKVANGVLFALSFTLQED